MYRITVCEAISLRKCISQSSSLALKSSHSLVTLNHHQRRNFTQEFFQSLSASKPVAILQDATIQLHDFTGMPWWATIITSTFLLRGCITFPLALYQNKILAKVEKLSTVDMPKLVEELKMETAMAKKKFEWTDEVAKSVFIRSLNKQWKNLLARDNCHPAKSFIIILFQLPLWIMQSVALRNMLYMWPNPADVTAQLVCAEMALGGFGWIPNLIEFDQSYILPVTLGVLNLAIVEISIMSKKIRKDSKLSRYGTYFFRGLSLVLVPISAFVPSGLALYWVSSSTFGLFQNLTLLSPKLRRIARIPKVDSELERPYTHLLNKIKERLGK